MKAWHWLLVGVAGWLLIGGLLWAVRTEFAHFSLVNEKREASARDEDNTPLPKGRPFTRVETNTFLDAAERTEKIADPLQRCLAYPDPPRSHWDHDAVVAYCKYRHQQIITLAQIRELVQSGRAAQLDGVLAQTLQEQKSDPDARGRLDRIYLSYFDDGSADTRALINAWIRQSPNSAFAYAASGMAYKAQAFKARGENYISDTPQSNIDSMERLAALADADLKRAQQMNPEIVPIYIAKITLGGMTFGNDYAQDAIKQGLAVAPDDYDLYDRILWLDGPNWGGSLQAMRSAIDRAQLHAHENPLLKLLLTKADFYRVNHCECGDARQLSAYIALLDRLARGQYLFDAGDAAYDVGDNSALVIYTSEELRFNQDEERSRINRIYGLVDFDRIPWAIAEADARLAKSPDDEYAIKARGWAYLIANDLPHAQADFETASRLNPDDGWALGQLSGVYMQTKQWDKAWDIADKMIAKAPQDPGGWTLRADIQMQQPRPGLKETTDYLESHFFTDKKNQRFNAYIAHLRTVLQRQANAPTSATHG